MQTFGFEIEHLGLTDGEIAGAIQGIEHPTEGPAEFLGCFGYHGSRHLGLRHHNRWVAERDSSVYSQSLGRGNEVVSPILHGVNGLRHLKKVMKAMKRAGASVNRTCGLHVTLGIENSSARFARMSLDKKARVVAKIADAYDYFRRAFDELVSQSRRAGSPNATSYCPRPRFYDGMNGFGLRDAQSSRRVLDGVGRGVVNLNNWNSNGTIEFRQHNGTMEGAKIVNFAQLLHKLCSWSIMNPNGYDVRQHAPTFSGLMEMLNVGSELRTKLEARREQVLNSRYGWFDVTHLESMMAQHDAYMQESA